MSDKASGDGPESDQTFDINIKTLETQVHKVRVTKDMTVSALKEKIVDLTALPVEQQRLIFRGRVLKDTDPLSEYHVEAGHTLHLVARRPTEATETNNNTGTESDGNGEHNRQRNVLLGAVNISDRGDDIPNLIMQGIGELLRTIGAGVPAPGAGPTNNTLSTNAGNGGSEQNGSRGQAVHQVQPGFAVLNHQLQFSQIPPLIPRNMIIPDSLTTLQEFIHRMERVLTDSGSQNNAQDTTRPPAVHVNQRGVPTSDALVSVLAQARQLLTGSFTSTISHLMERLGSEAGSTDARQSVQSEAMRAGISMQHMGALLLELGRTTMALRVGPTPDDSFVNAGPAAYIHSNGPNPIMVQPVALQTSPLIGGPVTGGNAGLFPGEDPFQNINIEIHAGSMPAPGDPNSSQQTQPTGDPQPIRSLAPGVPARTTSGPTGHIVSVIYPVQVRTTQVTAGAPPPASAAPQVQPTGQNPAGVGDNGLGSLLGQISAQLTSVLSGRNLGQVNSANNATANVNIAGTPTGTNANIASTGTGTGTPVQVREPVTLRARSLNRQGVIRSSGVQPNTPEDNNQGSSSDAVASSASDTIQSPKQSLGTEPPAPPLGLGLGGLRPAKKTKQLNSAASGSGLGSPQPPNQNPNPMEQMLRSLLSASGSGSQDSAHGSQPANPNPNGQIMQSLLGASRSGADPNPTRQGPPQAGDIGSMLTQVFQSPALDGLLTSMAGQTGMGSPNELRSMLEQCTQDPAVEGMFSDLVSQVDRQRTGASNGGVDLSGLVQKMMPIVANVISSGTGTTSDQNTVPAQQAQSGMRIGEIPLQRAAVRIEGNDSATNIFTSVVESAGFYDDGDADVIELVEDLCSDRDLANEYMNVLYEEIRKRLQSEPNSGDRS